MQNIIKNIFCSGTVCNQTLPSVRIQNYNLKFSRDASALFCSCGHGPLWRDAGTDTGPLGDRRLAAQSGPSSGHLCHHTDWTPEIRRPLQPWGHAVPFTSTGQAGQEDAPY